MNGDAEQAESASFAAIIDAIAPRLAKNERVRRKLPGGGRLKFDRQLPFLCIYREPEQADGGTRELVTSEAAYLFASGDRQYHAGLCALCNSIAETMEEHFGLFLFIEICSARSRESSSSDSMRPAFEVIAPEFESMPTTVDVLVQSLKKIRVDGMRGEVQLRTDAEFIPPALQRLSLAPEPSTAARRFHLLVSVRPIYRDTHTGVVFPMVLQSLRNQLAKVFRRTISEFTGANSTQTELHHEALGPTALVKAARLVDQQLCEVSESFDFLLQVTPVNSDQAWCDFATNHYATPPVFYYRSLPYRPSLLKRRLFDIAVERIEDTTLAHLFWEKQDEIDRQLTALRDLGTSDFVFSSQQLYGAPEPELVQLATDILVQVEECDSECSRNPLVCIDEIVHLAREEIDYYHHRMNAFNATVELRDDIAAGIMVSHDRLLLSNTLELRADRLEPLLHHEIGTHLLTYFNGRCQPFRQLYAGLAGYEELQEGLAVLAEYLTGGLTRNRIRGLAARVIAVEKMLSGAKFVDTFQCLVDECHLMKRQAFVTTLRAYRGGGFTKDIIYLRGLRDLLSYLQRGHDIEPLYVGKIGLHHMPYVQEMRRRGIINAPGVLPRFLSDPQIQQLLERCRGMSVTELLEPQR